MPEYSINLRPGSFVFPIKDKAIHPVTYVSEYGGATGKPASADELSATAAIVPAGGSVKELTTRIVSVDVGHAERDFGTVTRVAYVRHPQDAYDNPVQSIDPSTASTGRIPALASSLADTLETYDPATGEKRTVPKVKSAVDFGHAPPHVLSTTRQDYLVYPPGSSHTMSAAERAQINLVNNKAKFVLGYDGRTQETEYMAGTTGGLTARPSPSHVREKPAAPRDCPDYTTAGEFSRRVHVKLGYEHPDINSTQREGFVRYPDQAYVDRVKPVDPSTYGERPGGMDSSRLAVTTATGAVVEIGRVKSAVDFGHDEPHHMSVTMSQQHTTEPALTRKLGAGHVRHAFHITPYVPVVRNVRYESNQDHPALARQAELQAEAAVSEQAKAFETAVLAATMFDNKDVATKVRVAGTRPPAMAHAEAVGKVMEAFGGQTISGRHKLVEPNTTGTLSGSGRRV